MIRSADANLGQVTCRGLVYQVNLAQFKLYLRTGVDGIQYLGYPDGGGVSTSCCGRDAAFVMPRVDSSLLGLAYLANSTP